MDARFVVPEIATALGIELGPSTSPIEALGIALVGIPSLVVIDIVEQIAGMNAAPRPLRTDSSTMLS